MAFDKERLSHAISEEKKRKARGEDDGEKWVTKKQKAFEGGSHDVTEEDLGMVSPSVRHCSCPH